MTPPDPKALIAELFRRDRTLAAVGAFHALLAVVFLVLMPLDPRQILGLDPWVKPFKFAASIALFTWTLAWFLGETPAPRGARRAVSLGVGLAMVVEIVCIAGQSARGTTSHFNAATPFDAAVFNVMGGMIVLNTLLLAVFLVLHLRWPPVGRPTAYLWGVRLGTVALLLGSAEGGLIVSHMAHSVGAPDGGPGLPLVNWSTEAGDLRVAHFLGLHAFQALPLAGWLSARHLAGAGRGWPLVAVLGFSALWVALMFLALAQALAGQPLIRL